MKIVIDLPNNYEVAGALPDAYEYDTELKIIPPCPNFIMTRDSLGNVLSRYKDNEWNYHAYNMKEAASIFFSNNISDEYIDDAKWLVFILDRVVTGKAKNGNNFSVATLQTYCNGIIKPLCHYAKSKQISIFDVLNNNEHMAIFVQLNVSFRSFCKSFSSFITLLNTEGQEKLGFVINVNDVTITKIKKIVLDYESVGKQTPVIPPRLYGNFINQAWGAIAEYKEIEEDLLAYLKALAVLPSTKIKVSEGGINNRSKRIVLAPFLKENYISTVLKKHGLGKMKGIGSDTIITYLNSIRSTCKHLIHVYSGMRDTEALYLPDQCYGKDPHKNRKHARLLGHSFKYTGFKSKGSWVTTADIERVIKILNEQNVIIVDSANKKYNLNLDHTLEKCQVPCPLFISTSYLSGCNTTESDKKSKIKKLSSSKLINNPLYDVEQFRITEKDLTFLQRFEPERDWELEGFNVGEIWNFTSHQLRRSLAVYSRQSGLVSIGSVQTQLHHLFVETSYYYSNNAENCEFDITDKGHMAKEFAKNQATADFSAFVFDIMFSVEPLHGVRGNVFERTIRQVDDQAIWITENRKETEKKFKKGLIAHADTPLGSCSSIDNCNEKLTKNFICCIRCEGASLKLSKIEKTIEKQKVFVDSLIPTSVEYRSEKEDLEQLIELRNKVA